MADMRLRARRQVFSLIHVPRPGCERARSAGAEASELFSMFIEQDGMGPALALHSALRAAASPVIWVWS